jgi:beta-phosphoglucomutase-like phosphatase (HAD superfamily)
VLDFLIPMPLEHTPGAILFDCDGTLADTMPLHYKAWRATLDALGHSEIFPEAQFYAWGGVTAKEITERLNAEHALQLPPIETAAAKEQNYLLLLPEVTPIEAVIAEARRFFGRCPLGVVSGGQRELVEETLERLGIRTLFRVVIGSHEVAFGKPAPDGMLLAARLLGVEPTECVVFEDAPAGLEAARRANMKAVDVLRYL